jgi:UDP-N-acetylmuramoyl-L-alanyl-D-glutamate--2,6-diaminopimelate ligase
MTIPVGVFTNLSRDHIGVGEHRNMAEYREAKLSLFREYGVRTAVLNGGDPFSNVILEKAHPSRVILYGKAQGAGYRYRDLCPLRAAGGFGTHAVLCCGEQEYEVTIPFAGMHYVEDFLAALATAEHLSGADPRELLACASTLSVAGRCEVMPMANGATFVVDYAHNGASLRAALSGLRPYTTGRLFCLFGAVGERTQCRRRDMALAAFELSDLVVITEDNSGEEEPAAIIGEIYRALPDHSRAICIPDRKEAIAYLIGIAKVGDVVLLAGKGDEEYQLTHKTRIPFSEKDILAEYARFQGEK